MIPIIYDKDEISFISNGLGRLDDCISCKVTEERNGIYECDFEYPITGRNYDLIQLGRIIAVTHDDTGDIQPFDIVSYSKPIDGIVTFHCTHISYRQSLMTVDTSTPVNSLADAFNLLGTATPTNPFSYETDKTSTGYVGAINGIPRSVRQILGGIEGSILDAYGGEYEFDRWTVRLWSARGQLRDFTIRYGVNMTTFNDETDVNGTYSSCIPYWTNGEETVVGDKVDSAGATITGRGECVPVDVSEYYEDKPSKAQVEAKGAALMDMRNPYSPTQTIEVSFVRLQDLGFDDLSNLYQCKLCDKINVIFPKYNMTGQFKIVRIVYNVLAGRYESMELGTLSVSLAQALGIDNNSGTNYNPSGTAYLPLTGGTITGALSVEDVIRSANSQTNIILSKVTKADCKAIDSSLDTTSTTEAWLTALIKALCVKYPNKQGHIYKGSLNPNTRLFYEIDIYDTSVLSNGLPQYSYGTYTKYSDVVGSFGTSSHVLFVHRNNTPAGIGALATSGGTITGNLTVNGSTNVGGTLTLASHSSAVGTIKNESLSSATALTANTAKSVVSISLEAGTWLVVCGVRFDASSTGQRMASFTSVQDAPDRQVTYTPASTAANQLTFTRIETVTATSQTWYLTAFSSQATNVWAGGSGYGTYIRAVRLV